MCTQRAARCWACLTLDSYVVRCPRAIRAGGQSTCANPAIREGEVERGPWDCPACAAKHEERVITKRAAERAGNEVRTARNKADQAAAGKEEPWAGLGEVKKVCGVM